VRAEEEGVMLDFSSIFFFGLSLRPKIRARGLMRKSRFFAFLLFWDGTSLSRKTKAKEHLKNRKRGKKKERREEKKEEELFSSFSHQKKKNESSLCTPSLSSLSSLSLSLLVPHKDIHIHN